MSTSSPECARVPPFDAVVLAGARSTRLGGADKAGVQIGAMTLLERVLDAVAAAETTIVVGPHRDLAREVRWCQEEPPDGGPVAAFAAGLALARCDIVVLLGVDLPFIAPAIPALLTGLGAGTDAAALVDAAGRVNFLASAWRAASARRRVAELPAVDGVPMRALYAGLVVAPIVDVDGWGSDCDTWSAIETARLTAAPLTREATP